MPKIYLPIHTFQFSLLGRKIVICFAGHAHLQGKEVREALQPLHSPVHVVSQKQKLPRCDVHPQFPHVVGEEV